MSGKDTWEHKLPLAKRFWLKVYLRGDCWEWRSHINPQTGYGMFNIMGEAYAAHRLAYVEAKGEIPPGYDIDHLCRHRWCVKPSHLEAVPHQVNLKRGWNQNRKKKVCPKCAGPFQVRVIRTTGKVQRSCQQCKRR